MYTDDKGAQIVLSLLKAHNIKKIIVSPGTTNVPIAGSVQHDPFFEAYSVVDERSAAYFATGLSFETGKPVCLSCTGATASRNYLSGLTEAYYRNLPIIAITSQHRVSDYGNLAPQVTNRSVSQLDIKRFSVHLPVIRDARDEEACVFSVNKALLLAMNKGRGPVHINLLVDSFRFTTAHLPTFPKIDFYSSESLLDSDCVSLLKNALTNQKIALFIGSHSKINDKLNNAIEAFVDAYNVTVFYDHTSNYHGKNAVLTGIASDLKRLNHMYAMPDIIIDIGSITGDFSARHLFTGSEFWRISEDGEFHQRFGNLRKQFDCSEYMFFSALAADTGGKDKAQHKYYHEVKEIVQAVDIPELPLSNTFIAQQLSEKLPKNSSLHVSISSSLRNIDLFEFDPAIDIVCNVGGFGIDGPVSTLAGQSVADTEKLCFGLIGDLAFFYDMNALGIRHIDSNMRIILVNNGCGITFRNNATLEAAFGDKLNEFIAAGGHHGSAKAWAESMGFIYMSAEAKDELLNQMDDFCDSNRSRFNKPVLFEVFISVKDEQDGLRLIREANRPKEEDYLH